MINVTYIASSIGVEEGPRDSAGYRGNFFSKL
jgi:hypothetical protein